MVIRLHKSARTTPAIRRELQTGTLNGAGTTKVTSERMGLSRLRTEVVRA